MKPIENFMGYMAGALTSAGMVAQIWQIISTGRSEDVSLVFFTLMLLGVLLWLYYGLKRRDLVLIFWNIFGAACCTTVLVLKIFYG